MDLSAGKAGDLLHDLAVAGFFMAHIAGVQQENRSLLAAPHHETGVGNQQRPARTQILIPGRQGVVVIRREPVQEAETAVQLEKTFAEILAAIPGAVGRDHVDIAAGIDGRRPALHPDGTLAAGSGDVVNPRLCQGRGIVGHHEPMIGRDILMRSPANDDVVARPGQARPLVLHQGAKPIGLWDDHRSAEFFGTGGDVQGMEGLGVRVVAGVLRPRQHVDRPAGLVNVRGAFDANIAHNVQAVVAGDIGNGHGGDVAADKAHRPQQIIAVGIEGVNVILHGFDEHDVVGGPVDGHVGDVEGRGVGGALHRIGPQFAELINVYI